MVFLSISRGASPSTAQPLLVTSDAGVVRAAVEAATQALLGNLDALNASAPAADPNPQRPQVVR